MLRSLVGSEMCIRDRLRTALPSGRAECIGHPEFVARPPSPSIASGLRFCDRDKSASGRERAHKSRSKHHLFPLIYAQLTRSKAERKRTLFVKLFARLPRGYSFPPHKWFAVVHCNTLGYTYGTIFILLRNPSDAHSGVPRCTRAILPNITNFGFVSGWSGVQIPPPAPALLPIENCSEGVSERTPVQSGDAEAIFSQR